MPKHLAMPPTSVLPPGARRDYVECLFDYLKAAGRPTLQEISDRIAAHDDLPGTASKETVRRMLQGVTVPRWPTAYSVFVVLCELAKVKPGEIHWSSDGRYAEFTETHDEVYRDRWNSAVDAPASTPAVSRSSGFFDEPPF